MRRENIDRILNGEYVCPACGSPLRLQNQGYEKALFITEWTCEQDSCDEGPIEIVYYPRFIYDYFTNDHVEINYDGKTLQIKTGQGPKR